MPQPGAVGVLNHVDTSDSVSNCYVTYHNYILRVGVRLARETIAGQLAGQYMYSELEIAISGVKSCQRSVYPVPFRVSYIGGLCFFRLQELDSHRPGIFCSWLHLQLHGLWSYASI